MSEIIISWFVNFPAELATFLLAMIPITELRASIPVAIIKYDMAPIWAFFWSVSGNIFMGIIMVMLLEPITRMVIEKVNFLNKLWTKYVDRIRGKNEKKFKKWGAIILITFVAIPLPMTGIFSGAVAASIFQIPVKPAIIFLFIGSLISGILVTAITLSFSGVV